MSTPKPIVMLLTAAILLPTVAIAAPAADEEPQDRAVREGMERVERLRNCGSDKERWSSVWLHSESTSAPQLSMTVVKDAGTQMALDPVKGDITFTSKQATHRFHLTAAKGEPKSPCPDYTVQILEASARHTLIQHTCNKTEYRPNKFHSSVNYFLYDLETASMRSIWTNSAFGKHAPLPSAEPNPKLKVVAGGYKFDWQPSKENRDGESQFERHMSFQRKLVGAKKELVCFDHTFPKSEAEGSGACAAQRLTRVDI